MAGTLVLINVTGTVYRMELSIVWPYTAQHCCRVSSVEFCFRRSSCTSVLFALRTSFCSDLYYLEVGHPACGDPRSSCTYLVSARPLWLLSAMRFNLIKISSCISFPNEPCVVSWDATTSPAPYCVLPALVFYWKIRANQFRGVSDRFLTHLQTLRLVLHI